MGFLKNLFGAEIPKDEKFVATEKNIVYAPLDGTLIPLKEINDGVFSEKILGQGCGIWPGATQVNAPSDGIISQVADTKHAVGIQSNDGLEILIHVGLDTVEMNGKGFTTYVHVGDHVKCGQKLLSFDKKAIADAGYKDVVVIVVTNSDDYQSVELIKIGPVNSGEKILFVN